MLRTIITQLSILCSLIFGIIISNDTTLSDVIPKRPAVIITIGLAIIVALWEIRAAYKSRAHVYTGRRRDQKILKYMARILSTDERCVISSNDLSWVTSDLEIVLMKKAQSNSLTLIMPKPIALSRRLRSAGATVHYYGENYTFRSRFTLISPNRNSPRVAIGYGTDHAHTIRTFHGMEDPAVHLAIDLYELAKTRNE